MKNKKISFIISAIIIIGVFCINITASFAGVTKASDAKTSPAAVKKEGKVQQAVAANDFGNSTGNIADNAFIGEKDGSFYIASMNGGIYKCRDGFQSVLKLSNDRASCINVVGDTVYYLNITDKYCQNDLNPITEIIKMKTDGTKRTRILSGGFDNLIFYKNKLYFVDYEGGIEGYRVSSIEPNGANRKNLITDCGPYGAYNITEKYIYYCAFEDYSTADGMLTKEASVYRTDLDGRNRTKLVGSNNEALDVQNDTIFFMCNDKKELKVFNKDEIKTILTTEEAITNFRVYKDFVYYIDGNKALYRMKPDGSDKKLLKEADFTEWMNFLGDYLYINIQEPSDDEVTTNLITDSSDENADEDNSRTIVGMKYKLLRLSLKDSSISYFEDKK